MSFKVSGKSNFSLLDDVVYIKVVSLSTKSYKVKHLLSYDNLLYVKRGKVGEMREIIQKKAPKITVYEIASL